MPVRLTRRSLLAALAAAPLAACAETGEPAPRIARFRSVRVDVSGLAERGLPNYAVKVAAFAKPRFEAAFADRTAPGDASGADLVVAIDQILLTGDLDSARPFSMDAEPGDQLVAKLLLTVGGKRRTIPFRVSRAPDSGPWYAPEFDDRRLADLLTLAARQARADLGE